MFNWKYHNFDAAEWKGAHKQRRITVTGHKRSKKTQKANEKSLQGKYSFPQRIVDLWNGLDQKFMQS